MKKRICCITIALCTVFCIVFTAGCSKAAKSNAVHCRRCGTTVRRSSGNTATKPIGTTLWRLPSCTGAAGENGKNGTDGKDGKDGKAVHDGKNGINGTDGKRR